MKPLSKEQQTAFDLMKKGWTLISSEGFGGYYRRLQKPDERAYSVKERTLHALLSRGLIEGDDSKSNALDAYFRLKVEGVPDKSVPAELKTSLKIKKTEFGMEYEHESFGLLHLGEVTGEFNLVGSSVEHRKAIMLTISRAVKKRDLHQEDFFEREELIEIYMSPTQFAEAISSLNHGSTPVTISCVQGVDMEDPPVENFVESMKREITDDVKEAEAVKQKLIEKAEVYLRTGGLNKTERMELLDLLRQIAQHQSNSMFTLKQFNEQMDKVIFEAKSEVDTFLKRRAEQLGVGAVKDEVKVLGGESP